MSIEDYNFPFPQYHSGIQSFFLYEDSIELVDGDLNVQATVAVTAGDSWHVVDYGGYVVFANGACVVTYDITNGFDVTPDLPVFGTCCDYNGQLFAGNFLTLYQDYGQDAVGWSKIGEAVFELTKHNVSGFAQLNFAGTVKRVMKLGGSVMVYSDRGVSRFVPVSEPVVGFGRKDVPEIGGVAGRSAVGGDEHQHVLVDHIGQLWTLKDGQQPTLLGYREYFLPMLGKDIVVTHYASDNSFYISDGETSYRWDQYGLCRIWQAVTSIVSLPQCPAGLFHDIDNQGFEIITDVLDFGFRGLKTLSGVEIGGDFDQPVFVSVNWRSHNEKYFRTIPWVRLNPNGWANLVVTAEEFQIKLSSQSQRAEIDYMQVKFQISDKRNLRGSTSADTTNG